MARPPHEDLPAWLAQPLTYVPPTDRDSYLRDNLLKLASVPERLARLGQETAPFDRILAKVPALLRLVGLLACIACVSSARNMAFVWLVLAGLLASLATRPLGQLRAIVSVAVLASVGVAAVAAPAPLMGLSAPSTIVRMALKTFCTVCLSLGFAEGVGWPRLAASLASAHVPADLIMVIDGAIRGIVVLGRTTSQLTESLALRSLGHNRHKSGSAGAILGMTFVRSSLFAEAQHEAMVCRSFGRPTPISFGEEASALAGACYALAMAMLVASYVWLDLAMGVG